MRFPASVVPLCCSVLVWQLAAAYSTGVLDKTYKRADQLQPIEPQRTVSEAISVKSRHLNPGKRNSTDPFSQSLVTWTIEFEALCATKKWFDEEGRRFWRHSFDKAACDTSWGNDRLVKYTCHAWYNYLKGPVLWRLGGLETFHYECPEETVCRRVYRINPTSGSPLEETACVDVKDVKNELVTRANSHADSHVPNVHCSLSLALPGTEFTVKPGVQSIDITLTEEVRYKDGSPYPAPMLYIRDKTSWRGYDRVFRRHASVASTEVTLTAVKGKFLTRTFEFCMQLLPGLTASAVTFSYSWFQTSSIHSRTQNLQSAQEHDSKMTVE